MTSKRTLLLAALALSTAAAQGNAPGKTIRLSDPALPFTISLPTGWLGVRFNDGLRGVNIASARKSPAALMRFTFIPKQGQSLNLANEFRAFEGAVTQGGGTLKLLSSKAARYGGVTGLTHVYTLNEQGKNLKMQIWFGNGRKNFYNFQLTDAATDFSKHLPLFTAALTSVQFQ
ncbi:hypothetical protein MF271_08745 [Deinococcus sp. KNUC1210]|uniref:hypothetical protein n=1 Tax=Deinococcus sp. KNUC1210 TaxID=2917691 RepID=UPI001EF02960|nr:hypothetical protein [Deinococcus sp. KNUC1210]ULH16644.1 hypothetical protein MF271_08745 [Deinococcus sp. KNUC1210]